MADAFAISVDTDVRALTKSLARLQKDQLPFAISQAITATGKIAQVEPNSGLRLPIVARSASDKFDSPSP